MAINVHFNNCHEISFLFFLCYLLFLLSVTSFGLLTFTQGVYAYYMEYLPRKIKILWYLIYTEILCTHMSIQKKWVGYLTFSCLYMYMVLNCCISFWLGSFFMSWSISSAMCLGRIESSRRSCWRASETVTYNIKLRIRFPFMQH